jgi:hypothetical protein
MTMLDEPDMKAIEASLKRAIKAAKQVPVGQKLLNDMGPAAAETESSSADIKKRMRDDRTTMAVFVDSRAYDDLTRFLISKLEEIIMKDDGVMH